MLSLSGCLNEEKNFLGRPVYFTQDNNIIEEINKNHDGVATIGYLFDFDCDKKNDFYIICHDSTVFYFPSSLNKDNKSDIKIWYSFKIKNKQSQFSLSK